MEFTDIDDRLVSAGSHTRLTGDTACIQQLHGMTRPEQDMYDTDQATLGVRRSAIAASFILPKAYMPAFACSMHAQP